MNRKDLARLQIKHGVNHENQASYLPFHLTKALVETVSIRSCFIKYFNTHYRIISIEVWMARIIPYNYKVKILNYPCR